MEATSAAAALSLVRKALALDPDCVDALLIKARNERLSDHARIEGLRAAVSAGEGKLGKEFLRDYEGHFWGLIETRPYMRARLALALALWEGRQAEEAIAHYEDLLRLNPNDNQGVRDLLVGAYLAACRVENARLLLHRYRSDAGVLHRLAKAIERFLAGRQSVARQHLQHALEENPHLGEVLQLTVQPNPPPDCYSPGSREEALVALSILGDVIVGQPGVGQWLKQQSKSASNRLPVESPKPSRW